jgi:hypothetical protein
MTRVESEWLTPREAGEILRITPGTLANWRLQGRGPQFQRMGKRIRYAREDVEAWLLSKEVSTPTISVANRGLKRGPQTSLRSQELEAEVQTLRSELERAHAEAVKARQVWSEERLRLSGELKELSGELKELKSEIKKLEKGGITTLAESESGDVIQVSFSPRACVWSPKDKCYFILIDDEAYWLPSSYEDYEKLSS